MGQAVLSIVMGRSWSALGVGGPTKIICSVLIAQAFDVVRYPILPKITRLESNVVPRDLVQVRDTSLCTPRDFDISRYFQIVKSGLTENFNYRLMDWIGLPRRPLVISKMTGRAMLTDR
jgi:hypothetical protein